MIQMKIKFKNRIKMSYKSSRKKIGKIVNKDPQMTIIIVQHLKDLVYLT